MRAKPFSAINFCASLRSIRNIICHCGFIPKMVVLIQSTNAIQNVE